MALFTVDQALAILAALAGAAHVLAPDHWLPASVLAWQRRWGFFRLSAFSLLAYALHVAGGFLIFLAGIHWFRGVPSEDLLIFSLVLIAAVTAVRAYRFSRIQEIQRTAPRNAGAILGVLSLLGPCESIIPIFIKANQLNIGYLTPFLAFLGGTFLAGTAAMVFGRLAWNRPLWLPRGLQLAHRKMAAFPVAALVAFGISFLVRLSS